MARAAAEAIDPSTLIAPELPGWISQPLSIPEVPVASSAGATRMLVVEYQHHVPSQEEFRHYAFRVESEAGLQQAGQIDLNFAPSYQKLRWHYLRIRRDGAVRDVLAPEALQILRQEQNADRFLYHGQLTVLAILHDVRVGDVVEWAYSRVGENPVFGGRFSTTLPGAAQTPIDRLFYRILTTPARDLQVATVGGFEPEHRIVSNDTMIEHNWTGADLKPLSVLPDAPGFEPQFPFVQISEFASWAEVTAWARELFTFPPELSAELRARVESVTASFSTQEEKANAALRFVQDDVRYLGIHFNESTHRPTPPDDVLRRRFGDCKDKSLLLVALLRSLGLRADVALVNSGWGRGVKTLLPSPLSFDHAIVRVVLPPEPPVSRRANLDGTSPQSLLDVSRSAVFDPPKGTLMGDSTFVLHSDAADRPGRLEFKRTRSSELWLDPTATLQGGPFRERSVTDFGFALVLAEGSETLTRVSIPPEAEGSVYVKEHYTLPDLAAPAQLEVVTTYRGATADSYRYIRRFSEPDRTAQQLTGLIARFYPKITARGSTEWTDDRDRNVLVARTRFEVPEFWSTDEKRGLQLVEVFPWGLTERLPRPESTERAFAFALPHPFAMTHEIDLSLPKEWPARPEYKTVNDDTFAFAFESTGEGNRIRLSYRWRTLADSVPAARVTEWTKKMAEVRAYCGYQLTHNIRLAGEMKRTGVVWSMAASSVGGLLAGVALGIALYRWPLAAKLGAPPLGAERIAGIGGWLVLVAIGVTLRPLLLLPQLVPAVQLATNWPAWLTLTDAESASYIPGFAGLAWGETFAGALFLGWAAMMVPQFYRRKASLPCSLAAMLIVMAVWNGGYVYWQKQVPLNEPVASSEYTAIMRQVLVAAIWVPYLFMSRRVKATFRS